MKVEKWVVAMDERLVVVLVGDWADKKVGTKVGS
jgi:hypothetical protein